MLSLSISDTMLSTVGSVALLSRPKEMKELKYSLMSSTS